MEFGSWVLGFWMFFSDKYLGKKVPIFEPFLWAFFFRKGPGIYIIFPDRFLLNFLGQCGVNHFRPFKATNVTKKGNAVSIFCMPPSWW